MPASPLSRSSISRRACDGCRRRKVKCDSEDPCANCRVSKIRCQFTLQRRKRGPRGKAHQDQYTQGSLDAASSLSPHQDSPINTPQTLPIDDSPIFLDCDDGTAQDDFNSPESLRPVAYGTEFLVGSSNPNPMKAIHEELLLSARVTFPTTSILEITSSCISLYMQYTYPTCPIIHEITVRRDAVVMFSEVPSEGLFEELDEPQRVSHMRAFTLVTAVCAATASVMPESLLPSGQVAAGLFFRASRNMLKWYEDYDLEQPDSSSLSIRDLHYTAAQHITGKSGLAFHVIGQATLLAQSLRLYNERSLCGRDPIESQLLRLTFWHLYLSDKASVCLQTRPCVLSESSFGGKFTLHEYGDAFSPLLDPDEPRYGKSFEERLLVGFHLMARLWSSSARLVASMRDFDVSLDDRDHLMKRLTVIYLDFIGIMDELPQWLQMSSLMSQSEDGNVEGYQKRSFWVQRCTLTMTFHCLKLLILQQCADSGFLDLVGLGDQLLVVAMKKMELIHDFIQTMEDIPFIYHQIKGEPSVERIRSVGTVLLELIQNVDNEAIKVRASSFFRRLLDILAKLNSKASEELSL